MSWLDLIKNKFSNKEKKNNDVVQESKNGKLSSDVIKIRVHALMNGTPIEKYVFDANIIRDRDGNSVITHEEMGFKEEMPGVQDPLVEDILYKLEARKLSRKEEIEKVVRAIEKQNKILKDENQGKINIKGEDIRININTEKQRLRLLKCVKYTLENKKGEGYYISIENDGSKVLNYLIRDGELIPYWFKTPDSEGEPVTLVPDVVQRKKYYKERTDEIINDYNNSQDTMWRGILGILTKAGYLLLAGLLIFGIIYNYKRADDLYDDSLQAEIDRLKLENSRIEQKCSSQIANQINNNEVLIDVAKKYLTNKPMGGVEVEIGGDNSNINI